MEVVRCKLNQSHYCIWKEEGSCQIEDMEAKRILSVSDNQLCCILSATSKLLRTPVDSYFNKFGNTDKGRLKIWQIQAKFGWIRSCDHWPFVGGHFNLRVCSGERQQGWLLFCNMLGKFIERVDYIKWFVGNAPGNPSLRLLEKQSYAEKVKLSYSNELKEKSELMKVNQAKSRKICK